MHFLKTKKGFTLIELLVVIAIIGILSSVVLASLNTARAKSRDAKRVTDIKQIQLALELYADQNSGQYPALITGGTIAPTYISSLPTDPTTGSNYFYSALGVGASCTGYHLGAALEINNPVILGNDRDASAGSPCTSAAADFNGVSVACTTTAGTDMCYDMVNQ